MEEVNIRCSCPPSVEIFVRLEVGCSRCPLHLVHIVYETTLSKIPFYCVALKENYDKENSAFPFTEKIRKRIQQFSCLFGRKKLESLKNAGRLTLNNLSLVFSAFFFH